MLTGRIWKRLNPFKHKQQVGMLDELLNGSRRISKDAFATNFGGIADDVLEMLNSDQVRQTLQEAREAMEDTSTSHLPPLKTGEFGVLCKAKELEKGEVAAIDGTFALPMQKYSAGQAICVAIGSLSHNRPMQDSLHYWSSRVFLSAAADSNDFITREKRGLFGIYPTSYLRYHEIKHGLEINEPYLFLDGPLIDEWLITSREGVQLYNTLFENQRKSALGVIKNIANPVFVKYARALNPREIYVVETLQDHLNQGNETRKSSISNTFKNRIAPHIFRGVFKPQNKAFGFEVHKDHFENMVRIMAADCQMNSQGHEIPFLLNRSDQVVRKNGNPHGLEDRIATQMAAESEELFFQETDERSFRSRL